MARVKTRQAYLLLEKSVKDDRWRLVRELVYSSIYEARRVAKATATVNGDSVYIVPVFEVEPDPRPVTAAEDASDGAESG